MSISTIIQHSWNEASFNGQPINKQALLDLLNIAVWAPNHHLREPWRFTWTDGRTAQLLADSYRDTSLLSIDGTPPSFLWISMKTTGKPNELKEDEAAIWCLIQNIRILAKEQGISVSLESALKEKASQHADQKFHPTFTSDEKLVAVLGMGMSDQLTASDPIASKIIRERRTVRQFSQISVDGDSMRKILSSAIPSAHRKEAQLWRIIEAGTDEERSHFADLMMDVAKDMFTYKIMPAKVKKLFWKRAYNIPFNLVFALDYSAHQDEHSMASAYGELCSIIHNFQLIAWEAGIGMVWSTSEGTQNKDFGAGLGLSPDEKIVGILHMGYLAKIPNGRPRTPADKKLRDWNGS